MALDEWVRMGRFRSDSTYFGDSGIRVKTLMSTRLIWVSTIVTIQPNSQSTHNNLFKLLLRLPGKK